MEFLPPCHPSSLTFNQIRFHRLLSLSRQKDMTISYSLLYPFTLTIFYECLRMSIFGGFVKLSGMHTSYILLRLIYKWFPIALPISTITFRLTKNTYDVFAVNLRIDTHDCDMFQKHYESFTSV